MFDTIPYITLWVLDFERTLGFYRDVMGLPIMEINDKFVCFATGGTHLAFHSLGADDSPPGHRQLEIHFAVQDVDAAYEALREQGVKFKSAPANMPWGVRMAAFTDPEGWEVELVGPVQVFAV
jgi:lactoylglutathione lyase